MDKEIHIISLRERPELAKQAIEFANEKWPIISKYFEATVNQTISTTEQLPLAFVLLKKEKIIGFFSLQEHDVVQNQELTPWITDIFVDEAERGHNLVKDILLYGRKKIGEMGYDKIYLCTHLISLYQKYGFKEIGLDLFDWGRPAKLYVNTTKIENKGKIVFLNGVSSSGKTTLALALQEKMEDPCFIIAQDIFRKMWGQKYFEDSPNNLYNSTISLLFKTVKLFSDEGKNVIVDHLIFTDAFVGATNEEGTLKDAVNLLGDYPVLFVHVTCDLETLRARERARGDRSIGNAEGQLPYLWPKDHYDMTIDTHEASTEESIERIINAVKSMEEPMEFWKLKKML